ncbi:MAG: hypothetical protein MJ252_15655, partial [archaeon]|nr:hypothetical protein [archaeon]
MEEPIDIIQADGKLQMIQSILIIFISSMINIFPIIYPFLFKIPLFLCKIKDDYNPSFSNCNEKDFCIHLQPALYAAENVVRPLRFALKTLDNPQLEHISCTLITA